MALHDDLAWNGRAAEAGLAHVAARYSEATLDDAMRRAIGAAIGRTQNTAADPPQSISA